MIGWGESGKAILNETLCDVKQFQFVDSKLFWSRQMSSFYRAMLAQSAVMRLHVVRLSVCPSVCP